MEIVSAMNACAGIADPEKAIQAARDALHAVYHDRFSAHTDEVRLSVNAALRLLTPETGVVK